MCRVEGSAVKHGCVIQVADLYTRSRLKTPFSTANTLRFKINLSKTLNPVDIGANQEKTVDK